MDAKYVGLLCKVQDRAVKAVLTEFANDLEKLKEKKQPLRVIGRHKDGVIEQFERAQKEMMG